MVKSDPNIITRACRDGGEYRIDLNTMSATCPLRLNKKAARKVLQEMLKGNTGYGGGWYIWDWTLPEDNERRFEISNSFYSMSKMLQL